MRLWASASRQTNFEVEYAEIRNRQTVKKAAKGPAGPNLVDPAILYSDRLREASAIAIGLSLAILDERLSNKRLMTNLEQIFAGTQQRNLLPPLLRINTQARALESDFGVYYLNYRARPFCLEVVSVGRMGAQSGDNFVLRVPDESGSLTNTDSGQTNLPAYATVWTSPDISAKTPAPFAPAADYAAAGWRQEILRTGDVAPEKLAELSQSLQLIMAGSDKQAR